ncbi:ABC transporter substrate-binding protein [Lentzea sp. E54]|uniref:ABC transporter substrate-binding protein n=1 Tax=Lentzea xerophila TaxID=3435883 RepID=UPI003DA2F6BD
MRRSIVLITSALLTLSACGTPQPETGSGGGGVTVEHAMGRTEIPARPKTVAALDTSYIDATLALETDLVAYTHYSGLGPGKYPDYIAADWEKYAKNAQPVGDLMQPDLEKLAGISPELIVSAKVRHAEIYDKLTRIGPTVFSDSTGLTWKENIRLLGRSLGREDLANTKISAYEARAKKVGDAIRAKAAKNPSVSLVRFVAGEQTVRLYTENSFPGTVLFKDAGLARPDGQPTSEKIAVYLSQEQLSSVDADRILTSTWADPKNESQKIKEQYSANPLWAQLKGQKQEVRDLVWIASVSLQGAHAMLDELARGFGVDPAGS